MRVEMAAIAGTYEELVDAAEDIADMLSAVANNRLDLTPAVERWLIAQLEQIEVALARHLDAERGDCDDEDEDASLASTTVAERSVA